MELSADPDELNVLSLVFEARVPQRDPSAARERSALVVGERCRVVLHKPPQDAGLSGPHQASLQIVDVRVVHFARRDGSEALKLLALDRSGELDDRPRGKGAITQLQALFTLFTLFALFAGVEGDSSEDMGEVVGEALALLEGDARTHADAESVLQVGADSLQSLHVGVRPCEGLVYASDRDLEERDEAVQLAHQPRSILR
jgi:hypothetical protein